MKKIPVILFLAFLCHFVNGQSWLDEHQKLYYLTPEGKVFIEPDYSSMAVYFDETPDNNARVALKSSAGSENIQSISNKAMVIVKGVQTNARLVPNQTKADRLKATNMNETAYDVLPAFKRDDQQIWLTKRVSIKLNEGLSQRDIASYLKKYDAEFIRTTVDERSLLLQVKNLEDQLELIQVLDEQKMIEWGQPDFRVEIVKHDDPLYPEQYQMNNTGGTLDGVSMVNDIDLDALEAWGITTGSGSITVSVIDDGVELHPDLPAITDGFTPASNGDGTPESDGAHGLSCAGIIAAQHNEIGVRGVAPDVSLLAVNIFEGTESVQDLADAFTWSANQGADVISNSWGFSGNCSANPYPVLTNAINDAATNGRGGLGCVILFSSGNDFNSCVSYPSNLASVISVGAVRPDGSISSYSNQGANLDIVAPSNDFNASQTGFIFGVRTTDRTGNNGYDTGDYTLDFGGTSAACPAAAGAAALVLSVNPALTSTEVYNLLTATADDMGSNGFDNTFGFGRVNAYAAVLAAGGVVDNTPPTTPTGLTASNVGSSTADLNWTVATDDVAVAGYNIYVDNSLFMTAATNSASLVGLAPSTSYAVAVSAYDLAGNESSISATINITTLVSTLSCTTTISSFPYAEGFESGDGWTQVTGDDGDWVRDSGGTPSSATGPSAAVEGSFYMFLEASTNGSTGQIGSNANAILESGCIDLSSETSATFSFQYHMYGSTMGSLEVLASTDDLTWVSLWSLSGNQGDVWSSVAIDLSSYTGTEVKLRMSGTTGSSWVSDLAIDDLSITTTTGGGGGGGCTSQIVDNNGFETGLGIWNDGGSDARRSAADATYANTGTYCVRLRDNTNTSVITTDNLDLSSFEDITVSFSYITNSMDNANEDFWLQISTDGGASFTTIEEWNLNDEFVNNQRYNEVVTYAGTFTTTTQLRFRCDASGNTDYVYLDDIEISGCSSGTTSNLVSSNGLDTTDLTEDEKTEFDINAIVAYPNPVSYKLQLQGVPSEAKLSVLGLSGLIIEQGTGVTSFDVSSLKSGMYFLRVQLEDELRIIKFIKQ